MRETQDDGFETRAIYILGTIT